MFQKVCWKCFRGSPVQPRASIFISKPSSCETDTNPTLQFYFRSVVQGLLMDLYYVMEPFPNSSRSCVQTHREIGGKAECLVLGTAMADSATCGSDLGQDNEDEPRSLANQQRRRHRAAVQHHKP